MGEVFTQSIAQRQRLGSGAFDRSIDESNTELMPMNNIIPVKVKWNEKTNGNLFNCTIEEKKLKKLIKELSWMNSIQTGKYFLKKSLQCWYVWFKMFAFKTSLGSECPGENILCPSDLFLYHSLSRLGSPATLGSFSPWGTVSSPSPNLFPLPGALFYLTPISQENVEMSPP